MLPLAPLANIATAVLAKFALKPLKYYIDSKIRQKVTPIPGSVLYCDLWLAVEHSGIHVENGQIANIVVDGVAESTVRLNDAESFTSKSTLGRKIYVSCDKHGPVGNKRVARYADANVGQQAFYGLVVKNCHQFSTKCVNVTGDKEVSHSLLERGLGMLPNETWEPTMAELKRAAKRKLGATKWRLWDWENSEQQEPEPDWDEQQRQLQNMPLTPETIEQIRRELEATKEYEQELADEDIPQDIRNKLAGLRQQLADIEQCYRNNEAFIRASQGAAFSYADLSSLDEDFSALARHMQNNQAIQELARKMGRNYISEEKKKQARIPAASRSEVHGTHRSDDLMRLLPSELVNLEDPTLETLFYARLLEHNLLTYELSGTQMVTGETTEQEQKRTGPVVACLDTSGSMSGTPLLKAKALLLTIAGILEKEDRALHVILFGDSGQTREFSMDASNNSAGLLRFLAQGFGGGTDFETPLKKAVSIIDSQTDYIKADILMVSDGDCSLSEPFSQWLQQQKSRQDSSIYSVLCAGQRQSDTFSDEVIVL
ncbi:MAG: VWA domain-containing protein [Gammaproteobacteria bacterium]|nr:VWA domain-containing protein [Gammaproteobacteria bacterium]